MVAKVVYKASGDQNVGQRRPGKPDYDNNRELLEVDEVHDDSAADSRGNAAQNGRDRERCDDQRQPNIAREKLDTPSKEHLNRAANNARERRIGRKYPSRRGKVFVITKMLDQTYIHIRHREDRVQSVAKEEEEDETPDEHTILQSVGVPVYISLRDGDAV